MFTGLGAAGAAAAAATLLPGCAPVEPASVTAKPAPEKGGGYQLTQHVQRYYQTAKV
ncbi:MAG: formate dehydrogenase [Burkholderiales bacterium]|nr:formate dehydrogenase [Burkholderiales bacterium]